MSEFDNYRHQYEGEINCAIAFSGKSQNFYTKVKADVLIELLGRYTPGKIDLLDIGCGNGSLHPFLLSSGLVSKLTGIEVAAEFLAIARGINPEVNYDVYDGRQLPYPTGRFDAAYTICVMHHVPPQQWSEFLTEMRRVVRPGGIVAVFEHNPFNPVTAHIVRTCPFDRNAVLLKPGNLANLMRSVGLDAVTHEFILFTPFANRMFRRFDRMISWLPLGAQYVALGQVAGWKTAS